jgi:hypothetical protein
MWKGAGKKEQVNKKSGEWGERGLRVSEKLPRLPSAAHHLVKGEGNLSEGRVAGDPSWKLPAGGSQHGWPGSRAYEWALTRPSTAILGASHWISHNLAVRFQGARRLLDKRTAHSPSPARRGRSLAHTSNSLHRLGLFKGRSPFVFWT